MGGALMAHRALSAPASRRPSRLSGTAMSSGRPREEAPVIRGRSGRGSSGNRALAGTAPPSRRTRFSAGAAAGSRCRRSKSRCWQACCAVSDVCLETPSACCVNRGKFPWLSGSGKFRTPCARMQRAKASVPFSCVELPEDAELFAVVAEVVGVPVAATPGLDVPPQPDASMARPNTPASAGRRGAGASDDGCAKPESPRPKPAGEIGTKGPARDDRPKPITVAGAGHEKLLKAGHRRRAEPGERLSRLDRF